MSIGIRKILIKLLNLFINYFWTLTAIAVISFFVCAYVFVIGPKYNSVNYELVEQHGEFEKEVAEQKRYLNALIEEKERMENINQYALDKMDEILPKQKNISALIQRIDFFARENDFLLESLQIYELKDTDPFLKKLHKEITLPNDIEMFNIDIVLAGADYTQLKQFLKMLEQDINLIDVMILRFKGLSSYSLRAITYYSKGS